MQIKINKIFDYAAIISGLILFSLAILTFCDVFGRRFLNSPVAGTIEIVEFGIALVAFLAMPRAFFLNDHVSADFIKNIAISKLQTFIKIFRFITPSFIVAPIVPLYVAWFFYMIRFYLMPYLMGYSVMGMLSFPLESEIAGEIYRLFGKN